jgi:hypothetical protein
MEAAVAAGIPLRPVAGMEMPLRPAAVAIAHPLLPTVGEVAAEVRTAGVDRGLKKSIFVSSSVKKSEIRSQEPEERYNRANIAPPSGRLFKNNRLPSVAPAPRVAHLPIRWPYYLSPDT